MPDLESYSPPGRVMVIALDGATWDLARPWTAAGHMPNLARLMADGVSAPLQAELPPSSVPNWPAFMTGKNAGRHGCVWWLQRDPSGHLDRVPIDSRSVSGDTLWSYLSAHGRRVIVQNVPATYPVEPVNGVMVSGLLTPPLAEDFVYPPSLKPDLDAAVDGYRIYPNQGYARGRVETYLEGQIANIHQHARAAEFLLRSQEWDFFVLVLGPTDEVAHKCWHYMDPQHPRHRQKEAARYRDSVQRIYTAADEAIGDLSRYLGETDTLIVMSDHGFGPVDRFFHTNNWLVQNGYLTFKKSGETRLKRMLFRVGFTPRNVYPLGKQLLSILRGSNALRQRLDPGRQGSRSPLQKVFLSNEDVDWSTTRVIASGFIYSQLFINLRGRDPDGIVDPAEYEPLRERLIAELTALVNPLTGQPHYARIYRREELYAGEFLERMPDLLCEPRDLRTADSGLGFRSNRLFESDLALSGTHRQEGIFLMRGPGIRRGTEIHTVRIYDLAPTILYRLDLPLPDDLDGEIIASAFEEPEIPAREVRFVSARRARPLGFEPMNAEDEETIKERLRDLGYLG